MFWKKSCRSRISFSSGCIGRSVNSKHNQTLWAVSSLFAAAELKAYRAESFWWQTLQLPSACECSLRWNFSISSLHSSRPIREPTGSSSGCGGGGGTADRVIRAPRGEFFQAAANSSFCLGGKIHVYTNRRCSEGFFFSLSPHSRPPHTTTMVKNGGGGGDSQLALWLRLLQLLGRSTFPHSH